MPRKAQAHPAQPMCFRMALADRELFEAVAFRVAQSADPTVRPSDINLSEVVRQLVDHYVDAMVERFGMDRDALLHQLLEARADESMARAEQDRARVADARP